MALHRVWCARSHPPLYEGKSKWVKYRNSVQKYLWKANVQQQFSKRGSQTSISIPWELVRKAHSQCPTPPKKTYWIRTSGGWRPAICVFSWSLEPNSSKTEKCWEPLTRGKSYSWSGKQALRGGDKMMRKDWVANLENPKVWEGSMQTSLGRVGLVSTFSA